jgi:hypothetical protein
VPATAAAFAVASAARPIGLLLLPPPGVPRRRRFERSANGRALARKFFQVTGMPLQARRRGVFRRDHPPRLMFRLRPGRQHPIEALTGVRGRRIPEHHVTSSLFRLEVQVPEARIVPRRYVVHHAVQSPPAPPQPVALLVVVDGRRAIPLVPGELPVATVREEGVPGGGVVGVALA